MKLLAHILALCAALALTRAGMLMVPGPPPDPPGHPSHHHHHDDCPHRCQGLEMDAAAVNEDGVPYFFKDNYLFKGFHDLGELFNQTFSDMANIHVDAAFRMHYQEDPQAHDRLMLFSGHEVYKFHQHKLEEGYPKPIEQDFPGIPISLDAAVECPEKDCGEDSVLFFKGQQILHFKIKTKTVESKTSTLHCSSTLRFLGHYYCLQGHKFFKFDPKTSVVYGSYPKETRDYFVRCSNYSDESNHTERERCSLVPLDAIADDGAGNVLAFRGHYMIHKHENGTLNAQSIESVFKELHSDVDAILTFNGFHHMYKGNQVFKYKVGEHQIQEGYPKSLMDYIGFNGPIDAALIGDDDIAHIIKGPSMISVNMSMTPHTSIIEHPIFSFPMVNAAMWHNEGVMVVVGNHYYYFKDVMDLATITTPPEGHKVSTELFGCDH